MKKLTVLLLGVILSINVSYADDAKYKNEVLAEVGNEEITFGMLERSYKKDMNHKNDIFSEIPQEKLQEYLDLYIQYRLKVQYALANKYDTLAKVKADYEINRIRLAESYYFDEKLFKPFLSEKFQRRKTEKKIAIIMQSYSEFGGVDSVASYDSAMVALNEIKSGIAFEDVAKRYSVDKVSRENGGKIDRWVTSGTIDDGLENPMYAMKAGEVYPELINTRKSFFILKVTDEAPRKYVLASHILIRIEEGQNADSLADVVLAKLAKGEKFEDLVAKYSQDVATVPNDGSLQDYYSRSTGFVSNHKRVLPKFETAMFTLKQGEISGKVKTEYGYHIIRCDSIKEISEKIDMEDLRSMYRRLFFYQDKLDWLDSLAVVYGYKLNSDVLNSFSTLVDSTKTNLQEDWDIQIPSAFSQKSLFEINGEKYSVAKFIKMFNNTPEFKGYATSRKGFMRAIINIIHPLAFELEIADYDKKNMEYAAMLDEFRDGTLLFEVAADQVWDRMLFDTVQAKKYYNKHKNEYKTDFSYDVSEILVFQDSIAQDFYKQIVKDKVPFDTIANNSTQRSGKRKILGHIGVLSTEKDERAIEAKKLNPKKGAILKPIKISNGIVILRINEVLPVRLKTFEEAIPDFSAEFQELQQQKLSEEWVASIKKDIPVQIKTKTISKIFKKK